MSSDEFSLHASFTRTVKLWWFIALATFMGGTLGYFFYHLNHPIYEATATFFVTLDQENVPIQGMREDLVQYNEDLALSTTEGALLSTATRNDLLEELKNRDILIEPHDLLENHTIERKHETWELRYRHTDPQVAMTVVNTWAEIGYQEMLSWQASGKSPRFVIFQPPVEALLPQQPVLYDRNRVMLAGAAIGFIVAVLAVGVIDRNKSLNTAG